MSQLLMNYEDRDVYERNNIDENETRTKLKKPVMEKWWFHLPLTPRSPSEAFPAVGSGPQCCSPSSTGFLLRHHFHLHHDLHHPDHLLCGVELGEDPVHLPLHRAAPLHAKAGNKVTGKEPSEMEQIFISQEFT